MAKKKLYQLKTDDEIMYLKLTEEQASFVEEIYDFMQRNFHGYVSFKEFEMPTEFLEIEED